VKAFVTGATGLLGNNLVRTLEAGGHEVVALVRNPGKASRVLHGTSVRIVAGDMQRVDDFAGELAGCDAVFHTAAYFREAFEPGFDPDALDEINIRATMRLLDAADAASVPCFVHVSSGGVVGRNADGTPGHEETRPLPIQAANPYFRSKLKGDAAIAAWRGRSGIAIVEMMPGWIWGPWDAAPTAAGKLYAEFVGRRIPANIGGGTSVVDARDVAAAMTAAASRAVEERRGETTVEKYIVGGHFLEMHEIMGHLEAVTGVRGPRWTIPFAVLLAYGHASEAWARATGGAPLITPLAVRTMAARIALDSSKARRELGLSFRDVRQTFADSAAWWREQAAGG
jgi:dihydroflavonol-4-reductase